MKQIKNTMVKNKVRFEKLKGLKTDIMKTMYGLRISIGIIFDRIGCQKDEYMQDDNIDETNMLKFMSHVERRTNEIL